MLGVDEQNEYLMKKDEKTDDLLEDPQEQIS